MRYLLEKARLQHESQRNPETGRYEPLAPNGADGGKTSEKVAHAIGVSTRTYERAKTILTSGKEEEVAQARAGEPVSRVHKKVKGRIRPSLLAFSLMAMWDLLGSLL